MKKMNLGSTSVQRPITRLFMLTSIDGKISTGNQNRFDFDQDIPALLGTEGLNQYYAREKETDLWTLCSGKTLEKISYQLIRWNRAPLPVTIVVCTNSGLRYDTYLALCNKYKHVIIATSNLMHIQPGADTLLYEYHNLTELLSKLHSKGCTRLTIQSGGELNAAFVRDGLVDFVELVIAPILVGGTRTPSLMDGTDVKELSQISTLRLRSVEHMSQGYLHLIYDVAQK